MRGGERGEGRSGRRSRKKIKEVDLSRKKIKGGRDSDGESVKRSDDDDDDNDHDEVVTF